MEYSYSMRVGAALSMSVLVAGFPSSPLAQSQGRSVDWVQAYDDTQNEHSFDYLLGCWVNQWPQPAGVKPAEGATAATRQDIDAAIQATLEHCHLEMQVRLDQLHIDFARGGMEPPEIQTSAERKLRSEIEGMFEEYWSRL